MVDYEVYFVLHCPVITEVISNHQKVKNVFLTVSAYSTLKGQLDDFEKSNEHFLDRDIQLLFTPW